MTTKFKTKRDYVEPAFRSCLLTSDALRGVARLGDEAYAFLNWRLEKSGATTTRKAAEWLNGHYVGRAGQEYAA